MNDSNLVWILPIWLRNQVVRPCYGWHKRIQKQVVSCTYLLGCFTIYWVALAANLKNRKFPNSLIQEFSIYKKSNCRCVQYFVFSYVFELKCFWMSIRIHFMIWVLHFLLVLLSIKHHAWKHARCNVNIFFENKTGIRRNDTECGSSISILNFITQFIIT